MTTTKNSQMETQTTENQQVMTYLEEIMKDLENGEQFENENAGWYTVNKPGLNCIVFTGGEVSDYRTYKSIKSYAQRIKQLMNRGY